MTAFSALLDEVYTITNRPDLVGETTSALKAATLKMHHTDFYAKDLYETGVLFPIADYQQQFQYKQIIPLYRSFKYARVTDPSTTPVGLKQFFEMISIDNSLDSYKLNRENVVYLAGTQLNFRSITQFQNILFGCYLHPSVIPDTYNSWIADEHPYSIIFETARAVFRMIGFDEMAAKMDALVNEEVGMLRSSQLALVGE